ncbi:hypothetical protein BT96DRAFT_806732, partial [Gymnopus androsaceus JB14]
MSDYIRWDTLHSPFASVIGTNHAPTTDELHQINSLLVHPLHELSRLESEIRHVQTLLDDLLSERQKINAYIEAHTALISPVRQIPQETLAEIFIRCLPTKPPYAIRSLRKAPLILTTICRYWRRVALNTPRLWNTLHFYLP